MNAQTIIKFGVLMGSMVLSRFVDTTNPDTLTKVRIAYVLSVCLTASVYFYIRTIVRRKHDTTKIYIVNNMLGQEIVEETTYFDKEDAMCSQAMTGSFSSIFMTLGIMSFKLGLHYGMIMQVIQLPFNIYSNPLFQKHVLNRELDHPWHEQTEVPLSKMTKATAENTLEDEIIKCWDDGELATYDRLLQLCRKAGVNTKATHDWTALMVVMGNPLGDVSVVKKLIDMGADSNMKDDEGWNCLHWAAYHSNVAAVEVMMESYGVSMVMNLLIQKNNDNLTPLEVAEKEDQKEFCHWLRTTVLDELEVLHDMGQIVNEETEKKVMPLLTDKE